MFENSNASSFITYHPSFGYFAEEYGLTMYSLEEEGKEATVTHLQEIIDIAKEKNIHTVFYQAEVDSKQSEAFAAEIDGNAVELAPLAADYLDNMEEMAKKILEGMN
jgi:zinc transport system substrate-binding protein